MQCQHASGRTLCIAWNAFSPALALRAAFGSTARRRDEEAQLPEHGATEASTWASEPAESLNRRHTKVESRNEAERQYREEQKLATNDKYGTVPIWQKRMIDIREAREELRKWHQDSQDISEEQLLLRQERIKKIKQVMKYNAMYLDPVKRALPPSSTPVPWTVPRHEFQFQSVSINVLRYFSIEIARIAEHMTPTPAERFAREVVVDVLEAWLSRNFPQDISWELFGSEKNGLAGPLSDIDIRIHNLKGQSNENMNHIMVRISRRMKTAKTRTFKDVVLRGGTYPMVQCVHIASGLEIQLVAARGTTGQQEVMARYLAEIPNLRELFLVVRTALDVRGLLDVYTGGLGSYGTFIALVAALVKNREGWRRKDKDCMAAYQLHSFLMFYATLDSVKYGVCVGRRGRFLKHDKDLEKYASYSRLAYKRGDPIRAGQWKICQRRDYQPYLLTLQDPADPSNDLGRNSNAYIHMQKTIARLRRHFRTVFQTMDESKRRAKTYWKMGPMAGDLVGRCDEIYQEARTRLTRYGHWEQQNAFRRSLQVEEVIPRTVVKGEREFSLPIRHVVTLEKSASRPTIRRSSATIAVMNHDDVFQQKAPAARGVENKDAEVAIIQDQEPMEELSLKELSPIHYQETETSEATADQPKSRAAQN